MRNLMYYYLKIYLFIPLLLLLFTELAMMLCCYIQAVESIQFQQQRQQKRQQHQQQQ